MAPMAARPALRRLAALATTLVAAAGFAAEPPIVLKKRTRAGQEVLLRGFAEFDAQCRLRHVQTIVVARAPTGGNVETRPGDVVIGPNWVGAGQLPRDDAARRAGVLRAGAGLRRHRSLRARRRLLGRPDGAGRRRGRGPLGAAARRCGSRARLARRRVESALGVDDDARIHARTSTSGWRTATWSPARTWMRGDRAGVRGADLVLHLHRLDDDEQGAGGDRRRRRRRRPG